MLLFLAPELETFCQGIPRKMKTYIFSRMTNMSNFLFSIRLPNLLLCNVRHNKESWRKTDVLRRCQRERKPRALFLASQVLKGTDDASWSGVSCSVEENEICQLTLLSNPTCQKTKCPMSYVHSHVYIGMFLYKVPGAQKKDGCCFLEGGALLSLRLINQLGMSKLKSD